MKNKDSDQESDESISGKTQDLTRKTTSTLKGNSASKLLPSSESDDDFGIGSPSITTISIQPVKENTPVETEPIGTPANSNNKNKPMTNNKKPSSNLFELDDETDDTDLFKPVSVSKPQIIAPTNPVVEPPKPTSSTKTENQTKSSIIPQRTKILHLSSDDDETFESKPSKPPEKISSTTVINKPVVDVNPVVNSSNSATNRKAKDPLFDESDSDETSFGGKRIVTPVPPPTVQQPTPVTSLPNQEISEKKPANPLSDSTDDEQDQTLFGKKPPVRNQTRPETITSNVQESKSTGGSTVKDIMVK